MRKVCLLIIAAICLPMMVSCRSEKSKKDSADKTADVKSQIVGIWENSESNGDYEDITIITADGEFFDVTLIENYGHQLYGHYEMDGNKVMLVRRDEKLGPFEIKFENNGNNLIWIRPDGEVLKLYRISQQRYDQLTSNITDWSYD